MAKLIIMGLNRALTKAVKSDSHMNIPLSRAAFQVNFPLNWRETRSVRMS